MLEIVGLKTADELFRSIPKDVQLGRALNITEPLSEPEVIGGMEKLAEKNTATKKPSFLGAGVYSHYSPTVVDHLIQRSEFFTSYTPYQPEVTQGTLQYIFEFQTLVCQLTGMEVANASMYDGSTSMAEAFLMAARVTRRNKVLVAETVHPEYIEVAKTYVKHSEMPLETLSFDAETGRVIDLSAFKTAPAAKPTPPSSESPRGFRPERSGESPDPMSGRGPRQEVSGERLRGQEQRRAPVGPVPHQRGKLPPGRKPGKTQITTAAEHKRVVKMGESIVIAELARQMAQKATDVLKKIWELGMRQVMINSSIDIDTAQLVAGEFDWRVESTAFQEQSVVAEVADKPEDLKPRAPVITIMGHVDHGKTSLLDAIRNANVAAGEAGGITQHIGAYKVSSPAGDVVFLDTPGHEAFTEMRARGAQVTDIVVLVVAADDGVMPQTIEALNHAKDAKVPIIVAVNKVDKQGAQPDRIRQQLAAHDLTPEEWGGATIYCDVSARTKVGVDKFLEMLALQSDVLELRANPNKSAKGAVIEARMDAKRGPVATMLIQEGTLRVGDTVVVGEEMGKVRAMSDDKGRTLAQAGPSTPVELLGLSGVPRAGEVLNAVIDERAAKELVEHRRQRRIERDRAKAGPVSLDRLMDAMKAGLKELKIILKADVQGSSEALGSALAKLSTKEVKVSIIQSGVGGITESDVNLAKAGNAIIIGFHVRPAGKAAALAEQEGVDIKLYDIIYQALDDVKLAMAGLLAPIKRDKYLGKAEVREVFNIPKVGAVAGCAVIDGVIKRSALARLIRDSVLIYSGKLGSLRRFKDDVREVQQGYECGMSIDGYLDVKVGDVIESYEVEEVAPTLA